MAVSKIEVNSTSTTLEQGLVKGWTNFNGSGTVAIGDSFNQSSLDDDGTGSYGFNFTNNMSSANYSATATNDAVGSYSGIEINSRSASGVDGLRCFNITSTEIDSTIVSCSVNGDLA